MKYWEQAARDYSRETRYNEEKEKYFLAGIKWVLDWMERSYDHGPYTSMMTSGDKALCDKLTTQDIKRMIRELNVKTNPAEKKGE